MIRPSFERKLNRLCYLLLKWHFILFSFIVTDKIMLITITEYRWHWTHRAQKENLATYFFLMLIRKPTSCTDFSNLFLEYNSTCFGQVFCPYQKSSTVHTAIGICHTGYAYCLLASSQPYTYCWVYCTRLLMMDSKPARNMYDSIPK